jgi:NAD(P)-dependent dehydrogenase (short-subunit alcohol dehydrogenase family)
MNLDGRVALVTGASRGIGAVIAKRLAGAGADVAVGYGSDEAEAGKVVDKIAASGRRAAAVGGEMEDPAEVERMVATAETELGSIDALVINAVIAPQ